MDSFSFYASFGWWRQQQYYSRFSCHCSGHTNEADHGSKYYLLDKANLQLCANKQVFYLLGN